VSAALPSEYARLSRWFPALSDRARAVGVTRQRALAWERQPAPRVRQATAEAIRRMASVSADVERQIGDASSAGRWLLTEQPALRGRIPAALVRGGHREDLALVAALVFGPVPQPQARRVAPANRPVTRAMPALPRSVPRERVRDADEAALLRLLGAPDDLIGPTGSDGD